MSPVTDRRRVPFFRKVGPTGSNLACGCDFPPVFNPMEQGKSAGRNRTVCNPLCESASKDDPIGVQEWPMYLAGYDCFNNCLWPLRVGQEWTPIMPNSGSNFHTDQHSVTG